MAEYLASIFGTEKDKVNCSFYFKIGACRHGDRCSRIHNKPTFSQTIVLQNLYINPQNSAKSADGSHLANVSDEEMQVRKVFIIKYYPGKINSNVLRQKLNVLLFFNLGTLRQFF